MTMNLSVDKTVIYIWTCIVRTNQKRSQVSSGKMSLDKRDIGPLTFSFQTGDQIKPQYKSVTIMLLQLIS